MVMRDCDGRSIPGGSWGIFRAEAQGRFPKSRLKTLLPCAFLPDQLDIVGAILSMGWAVYSINYIPCSSSIPCMDEGYSIHG